MERGSVVDPTDLARHLEELRAAARALAPSAEEADDLVQESLAVAVQALARVRHPEVVGAWLLQILRRRWYDRLRRRTVEKRVRAEHRPADGGGSEVDPEPVRRALRALPAESRRVLQLRFFDSRSSVEIARVLGKPCGTVRSMIFHALRKFEEVYRRTLAGEKP